MVDIVLLCNFMEMRFPGILNEFILGQVFCLRMKVLSVRKVDSRYMENVFPAVFSGLSALFALMAIRRKILEMEFWSEEGHLFFLGM